MKNGFDAKEDELKNRQGGKLYPIGMSLRSTFSPPDGEELQSRITSLMVELSHQPYEPLGSEPSPRPTPSHAEAHQSEQAVPRSLLRQLTRMFRRHH